MKRNTLLSSAVLTGALFLATGCATDGNNRNPASEVDYEYIQQVEAAAMNANRHVDVYWVNPPRKKDTKKQR